MIHNIIADLGPISGHASLKELSLSGVGIDDQDVVIISGFVELESLTIYSSQVKDISPLSGLADISRLSISSSRVEDISPIAGMILLDYANLENNNIVDLSPLVDNAGIVGSGDEIWIKRNPIDCQEQASNIQTLRNRGVDLRVDCP